MKCGRGSGYFLPLSVCVVYHSLHTMCTAPAHSGRAAPPPIGGAPRAPCAQHPHTVCTAYGKLHTHSFKGQKNPSPTGAYFGSGLASRSARTSYLPVPPCVSVGSGRASRAPRPSIHLGGRPHFTRQPSATRPRAARGGGGGTPPPINSAAEAER